MSNSSAARQLRQSVPKKKAHGEPKSPQKIKREHRKRRIRLKKLKEQRQLMRKQAIFCVVSTIVIAINLGVIVSLYARILNLNLTINNLVVEANDLRRENDQKENYYNASIDLEKIMEKATELGMHLPREDQIIYYTVDKKNYMEYLGE